MSFELKDVPETFQRALNILSAMMKRQHATFYVNNIIVFSRTPEERLKHADEVLLLLKNADVTIELQNASFQVKPSISLSTWSALATYK